MPALLGDEDTGPVERSPPPQRVASLRRPRPYPAGADERPCAPRGDPVSPPPTSGRARREEIQCRRRLLPDDLYYDPRYTADSILWDTWLRDEHDVRRASCFAGTVVGPRRAWEVLGRTRVRGLTPTSSPSPSSSPPPPPRMTEEEEARLMQRVMEDSMTMHDERQWPGLDRAMALSAAGDVAIPETIEEEKVAAFPPELVGASWGWSCTAPEMTQAVGAVNWCPTPLRSPEQEASPREEVLQTSFQPAPAHQGPSAHLWTPPPYVDLVSDGDDDDIDDCYSNKRPSNGARNRCVDGTRNPSATATP
ncbi:ADP-ribosylation factor-related protein 1 [Hordeum vulgare]|nr:ADP-ribosylation factor-related protein 1 [Hordeum vulgare]